ncbi:hypothetical protein PRELSG_9900400 [Plasmodium relictum]|uniref:Uncharacterized protein n=1 Tax=Plasmodium relictum TaxID=85471 RepID=A0A1J1GKL2_PLARL|nr:hypothetical protein PRELSG_9900400 [Plasmodium relictum]CRG85464.1 hypothetical protein PRELSG_9900400 [Plasmodium relictum]
MGILKKLNCSQWKKLELKGNLCNSQMPTSISSDILDSYHIPFNNEIMKDTKATHNYYLSKIGKFLHKTNLRIRLNNKLYMSFIVSIIIFFLQSVNTAEIYNQQLSIFNRFCNEISRKCIIPFTDDEDGNKLCDKINFRCKNLPAPLPEMLETKYLIIMFSVIFIILFFTAFLLGLNCRKRKFGRGRHGYRPLESKQIDRLANLEDEAYGSTESLID